MAVEQMASLAGKLGGRLSAANAESKDQPVDTGFQRLPSGIKGGIAKITVLEWKVQDKDNGSVPKGELQFRASAVVMYPTHHNGEKVANRQTSQFIALCDTPAKGQRKATEFKDNYFDFQNLFRKLGIPPCPETTQSDPTGTKTDAFWRAAIQRLTDHKNPTYLSFSTRGWVPPKVPGQQKEPEEMVFEEWVGLADPEELKRVLAGTAPGQGVTVHDPAAHQPPPHALPPSASGPVGGSTTPPSAPVAGAGSEVAIEVGSSLEDEVAELIEIADADPKGDTADGKAAQKRLEELAWAGGWSREQTSAAENWAEVGDMAFNPDDSKEVAATPSAIVIGSKWLFAKRDRSGNKLKVGGAEVAAQEVEVVTVNDAAKTCTAKYTKTGSMVMPLRGKDPSVIQFDWLESF